MVEGGWFQKPAGERHVRLPIFDSFAYSTINSCNRKHLFDDGTSIQVSRGVVSRSTDYLDSAGVRLVVRLSPHEGGQEAVFDHQKIKRRNRPLLSDKLEAAWGWNILLYNCKSGCTINTSKKGHDSPMNKKIEAQFRYTVFIFTEQKVKFQPLVTHPASRSLRSSP